MKCHFCSVCQRTWEDDDCMYPMSILHCPTCANVPSSRYWYYVDDFELWVRGVREAAGV